MGMLIKQQLLTNLFSIYRQRGLYLLQNQRAKYVVKYFSSKHRNCLSIIALKPAGRYVCELVGGGCVVGGWGYDWELSEN